MRAVRNALVGAAVVASAIVLAAGSAAANVGLSVSLTMPAGVAVGQEASGSFTVVNTNTPPNSTESNTVTQLRLAPSCGAVGSTANPCPTPDPGVFTITSATGAAGTACAGRTFTVSAPDAAGIVTFTTSPAVVLAPPGGSPGSDRCTVNFTFRVLKVPSIDSNPGAAGVQTRTNFVGQLTGSTSGLAPTASLSTEVFVARATPSITTQASAAVQVGGNISDTALVTGVSGVSAPTGTVTFKAYGPNDATCSGSVFAQSVNGVFPAGPTTGSSTSDQFPVGQAGVYRFVASYSGDANYLPVTSPCNAPNESVTVSSQPVPKRVSDFDGNGTTDIAVFRPAEGNWYIRTPSPTVVQWGQNGDIPVSGDYDGNGTTDVAVFRPGNGGWYLRTPSPQFVQWGQSGDIPAPGDYNGDGTTDVAVFRPGNGVWYLRTPSPFAVVWGGGGDVPVPGDYNGDALTDVAIFRPSTNTWYVRTSTPFAQNWGGPGDQPIPLPSAIYRAFFP